MRNLCSRLVCVFRWLDAESSRCRVNLLSIGLKPVDGWTDGARLAVVIRIVTDITDVASGIHAASWLGSDVLSALAQAKGN